MEQSTTSPPLQAQALHAQQPPPRPRSRKRIHTTLKWSLPAVPALLLSDSLADVGPPYFHQPAPAPAPALQHHQSRAHAFLSDRILPLARHKVRKTAEIVIPHDAARSAIPAPLPIPISIPSSSSRPTHPTPASAVAHPPIKTGTAPPRLRPRPGRPADPPVPTKPAKPKPYDPAAVQAYMKRKRAKLRAADPLDTIKDLEKPLHHVPSPPPDARRAAVPETKRSELVEFMEKKRALERVAVLRARRAEEDKERGKKERLRRLEEFSRRQREEVEAAVAAEKEKEKEKQARAASTTPTPTATPARTRPVSTTPTPMQRGEPAVQVHAQPNLQPQYTFAHNDGYPVDVQYQDPHLQQQVQQQHHRGGSHISFAPTPTLWSPPAQPNVCQPTTPYPHPPQPAYAPLQPLLPIPSPSHNLNPPHRRAQPPPGPISAPSALSRLHLDLQSILEDDLAHFNSTPTTDSTVRVLAPTSPPHSSPPSMVHTPYNFAISLAATDGGRSRAGSQLGRLGMSQESMVEYSTVTSHEHGTATPRQPELKGVSEEVEAGDGETTTRANAFVVTTTEAVEFAAGLVMQETSAGDGSAAVHAQPSPSPLVDMPRAEPDYFSPINVFARAMRKVPMPEIQLDASWIGEVGGDAMDSHLIVQDVREQAVERRGDGSTGNAVQASRQPAASGSSSASDRRRRPGALASSTPTILPPCDVSSILGSLNLPPNDTRPTDVHDDDDDDDDDNRMAVSSLIAAHDRALFDHESLHLASVLLDSIAMFAAPPPALQGGMGDQDPGKIRFQFDPSAAADEGGPPVLPLVPLTASLVGDVGGFFGNGELDAASTPVPAQEQVPVVPDPTKAAMDSSKIGNTATATQTPTSPVRHTGSQSPALLTVGVCVQTCPPSRTTTAVQTDASWTDIDRPSPALAQPAPAAAPAPANETAQLLQAIARMFADNQHLVRDLVTSQMSQQIRQLEARIEVLQAQARTQAQPATVVYAPQQQPQQPVHVQPQQPVHVQPQQPVHVQPQVIVLPMPTPAAAAAAGPSSSGGRGRRVGEGQDGYRRPWRRDESNEASMSGEEEEEENEMERKYGRRSSARRTSPIAPIRRHLTHSPLPTLDPSIHSQSPSPQAHSIGMESTDLSGSLPSPISPTSQPLTAVADLPMLNRPAVGAATQSPSDSFVPTHSLLAALNQQSQRVDADLDHTHAREHETSSQVERDADNLSEYANDFVDEEDIPESVHVSQTGSVSVAELIHQDASVTHSQSTIKSGSVAASIVMSTSIEVSEVSESAIVEEEAEEEEIVVEEESVVMTESADVASGSHAASTVSVAQSASIRSVPSASASVPTAPATALAISLPVSGSVALVPASASAHSAPASASQASAPRTASGGSVQEVHSLRPGASGWPGSPPHTTEAAADAQVVESETSIGYVSIASSVHESIASVVSGGHGAEQVVVEALVADESQIQSSAVDESHISTSSPPLSHVASDPDFEAPVEEDEEHGHTPLSQSIAAPSTSAHPPNSTIPNSELVASTSTHDRDASPLGRTTPLAKDESVDPAAAAGDHVPSRTTSISEGESNIAKPIGSEPRSATKSSEIDAEAGSLAGAGDESVAEVEQDVEAKYLDESFEASTSSVVAPSSHTASGPARVEGGSLPSFVDPNETGLDASAVAAAPPASPPVVAQVIAPATPVPVAQPKDDHDDVAETVSDTSIPEESELASAPPAPAPAHDHTTAMPTDPPPSANADIPATTATSSVVVPNIDSSHVQMSHLMHDISAVGITRSTSELFLRDGADSIPVSPTAKVFDTLLPQEHVEPAPSTVPTSQAAVGADKAAGANREQGDTSGEIVESISGSESEDSRVAESVEGKNEVEAVSDHLYSMDFESSGVVAPEEPDAHAKRDVVTATAPSAPVPHTTVSLDNTVARLLHHDAAPTSVASQEPIVRSDALITHTGDDLEDHGPAPSTPPGLDTTILLEETIPVEPPQDSIDLALVEPAADALFDDLLREMSMDVAAIERLQLDEINILEAAANKLFTIEYAERYLHYLLIHHHDEISASTPIAPRPHPIYKNEAANTYLADLASEFRDAYIFRVARIGSDGKEPSVPSFYFFRELMASIKQDMELSVARADDVLPWVVQELREERKRSFGVRPRPVPPPPHLSLVSRKSLEQFQTEKLELAVNELLEQLMEETAATALHLDDES